MNSSAVIYHNWVIGFEFIYPLSSKQDRANYLRAQLEKEKSLTTKIRLKQRIILEIKNSTREIQQNYKRIEAAKATTELMTEKLKVEEEKLAEGLSTNYYILDYQEDLTSAKANELAALIAYHKSIAHLQHAMGLSGRSEEKTGRNRCLCEERSDVIIPSGIASRNLRFEWAPG